MTPRGTLFGHRIHALFPDTRNPRSEPMSCFLHIGSDLGFLKRSLTPDSLFFAKVLAAFDGQVLFQTFQRPSPFLPGVRTYISRCDRGVRRLRRPAARKRPRASHGVRIRAVGTESFSVRRPSRAAGEESSSDLSGRRARLRAAESKAPRGARDIVLLLPILPMAL